MSSEFNENGIRFLYPENWSKISESSSDAIVDVMVQNASGAFWALQAFDLQITADELLDTALGSMRDEYQDFESSSGEYHVGSIAGPSYQMNFFCLDFLVEARLTCLTDHSNRYLILQQAEQREYAELNAVFDAMTTSLMTSAVARTTQIDSIAGS